MIFRLIGMYHAQRDLAAAREDATAAMRMYAQQCKRTKDAELERDTAAATVERLQGERDALAKALDNSRDIAAGYAADLAEAKRAGLRALPAVGDLRTAPAADLDEVARLRGELERTKQALAAATDRLAEYRDREEVAGRG